MEKVLKTKMGTLFVMAAMFLLFAAINKYASDKTDPTFIKANCIMAFIMFVMGVVVDILTDLVKFHKEKQIETGARTFTDCKKNK